MKFFLLIITSLQIAVSSCNSGNQQHDMTAAQYIATLSADKYPEYDLVPKLDKSDIGELLKHAGNNRLINHYPIPAISAVRYGPQQVGMIILYTVESIRTQRPQGVSSYPYVQDTAAPSRKVPLEELVPLYNAWWQRNKDKSAAELKDISPLAGTTLRW
ncbi:DUF4943 family protein [Chitinophaga solisilvae]|uniref:DUF4943 family protein n=1 Tax=Chitinophaga solisilvae TaxID=1233460 RepID=A0A433WCZ3_9BACT|nr:DUF4943 family protein [Chitinophaga solisilvae]NSL85924.1 DUF4943 family protein [Chitinophaga solisilvae]